MLERRERVEQWARKEEQGAGNSRSHARSLSGLGGEAVAGGSGGGGEERGVYASSSI